MLCSPTLKDVEERVRVQVCANCPNRTPGTDQNRADQQRSCERDCPLFVQLSVLTEAARQVDPMMGNPIRRLRRMIVEISRNGKHRAAVIARNGRKVIRILENLFLS